MILKNLAFKNYSLMKKPRRRGAVFKSNVNYYIIFLRRKMANAPTAATAETDPIAIAALAFIANPLSKWVVVDAPSPEGAL